MRLVVHELISSVGQMISIGDSSLDIYAIRPHIYKHGAPAGTVHLKIRDANLKLVAQSSAITITDIDAANYFHGHVRFLVNTTLISNRDYYIFLESSGYSYSGSAFVGWCTEQNESKLDLEIWENKDREKGRY